MTEVNSSAVTVAVQALRGEVERRFGWVPNESLRELFIVGLNAYNAALSDGTFVVTEELSTSDAPPLESTEDDAARSASLAENSEASQE